MQSVDVLDEFLASVTGYMTQYNYDKAKDVFKREKVLTTRSLFKEVINLLPTLLSAEKCYMDLGFLSSKSKVLVRKDNTLKAAFTEMKSQCEKLSNVNSKCFEYSRMLSEIVCYCKIRCQMIDLYDTLHSASSYNKHWKMEDLISKLQQLINDELTPYLPKTLTTVKAALELEICCLYDLLNAQFHLENWNLICCTSHITSVKSRLHVWEKTLHNKETWKISFLRSNTLPELYRWMSKFKIFVLEKFSLYFQMIIQQQIPNSDFKVLYNKHHLEFLQRFQTLSRKFGHEVSSIMLIFDSCGIKNWHGPGYHCPLKNSTSNSTSTSYYIMLKYPEKSTESNNLMPTIRKILVEHFSDILFLDKVVCRYLASENSTYYITSIEERISLVAFYNCRKDDRQMDIDNFMLELACMIRCHRIFLALNSSGR